MCTFTVCGDAVEVLSPARMMETKVHIYLKKLPQGCRRFRRSHGHTDKLVERRQENSVVSKCCASPSSVCCSLFFFNDMSNLATKGSLGGHILSLALYPPPLNPLSRINWSTVKLVCTKGSKAVHGEHQPLNVWGRIQKRYRTQHLFH